MCDTLNPSLSPLLSLARMLPRGMATIAKISVSAEVIDRDIILLSVLLKVLTEVSKKYRSFKQNLKFLALNQLMKNVQVFVNKCLRRIKNLTEIRTGLDLTHILEVNH